MYTYKEQLTIIKDIHLHDGERKTIACPFCGGNGKFTIAKIDGVVLWNCYRASCPAKGSLRGRRSMDAIQRNLEGVAAVKPKKRLTPLPPVTGAIINSERAQEYLIEVNAMEAVNAGYIGVRFAPAEKRVLFYNSDNSGAVGRTIGHSKYKWWAFGDTAGGIAVGVGDIAVLVEDVASACAISRLDNHVGYALLGTAVTKEIAHNLRNYTDIYVVLDNDATSKSSKIAKQVGGKVRMTKKDPKNLTTEETLLVLYPSV
jgi:hypothetical protein